MSSSSYHLPSSLRLKNMESFSLASAHRQNPDKQMPLTAREKIQEEKRLSSPSHSSLGIFLSLFLSSASREISVMKNYVGLNVF